MHHTVPTVRIKSSHPSQGEFVEINKSDFDPAKHELFGVVVPPPPPPVVVPPPPPMPPADVLANLPQNWRDADNVKAIAEAVTGRTPEDKKQAVEMIEAALAARASE